MEMVLMIVFANNVFRVLIIGIVINVRTVQIALNVNVNMQRLMIKIYTE